MVATESKAWLDWVDHHRPSEIAKTITRRQYNEMIDRLKQRTFKEAAAFPVMREGEFEKAQALIREGIIPLHPHEGVGGGRVYDRIEFTNNHGEWMILPPTVVIDDPPEEF